MWLDSVIPMRSGAMRFQIDLRLLFGGDLQAGLIGSPVQVCPNLEAVRGGCGPDELKHSLVIHQRLSGPIGLNMAEQFVLNRIPLRRTRRQVGDSNRQAKFIRHILETELPQPDAVAIRTATVGFDQQLLFVAMPVSSYPNPPFADRRHGEFWRLVQCAHHYEALVARDIEDAIQREVRTSLCGIATPSASLG